MPTTEGWSKFRCSPELPPRFGAKAPALQVILRATKAAPHFRFMDLCKVTRIGIAMHCLVAPTMGARHQLSVGEYSRVGHDVSSTQLNLVFNFEVESWSASGGRLISPKTNAAIQAVAYAKTKRKNAKTYPRQSAHIISSAVSTARAFDMA